MIHINKAEILDILPYTFKSDEFTALSKAIAAMTARLYEMGTAALFWADINHASPVVLDAIAAELDAPFYNTSMTADQRRAMIKAAYKYNSTLGTVSSMSGLLAAAFGGGAVSEWYDYDGEPYHFKLQIDDRRTDGVSADGLELVTQMIDKVKPKRAKLDAIEMRYIAEAPIHLGVAMHYSEWIEEVVNAIAYEIYYLTTENDEQLIDETGSRLVL